jgi:hypothetical protein
MRFAFALGHRTSDRVTVQRIATRSQRYTLRIQPGTPPGGPAIIGSSSACAYLVDGQTRLEQAVCGNRRGGNAHPGGLNLDSAHAHAVAQLCYRTYSTRDGTKGLQNN